MSNSFFDDWGWYSTDSKWSGRVAAVTPATIPAQAVEGQPYPNWTGYQWVMLPYTKPPESVGVEPSPEPSQPWEWLIDIGAFFDRFGAAKMAVLTSADPGVQAILKDTQIRKWVALNLPEVAQSISYIGTKVPAVTTELQSTILNTPVGVEENLVLRKLYFS